MQSVILTVLMPIIMGMLEDLLTPQNLQKYGDKFFDFVEDAVADSETKIDDLTVLPVIQLLRRTLNIPDND